MSNRKSPKIAHRYAFLDPQAEALLTEAQGTIRNQAETIGTLTAERNEAQREARALNATMDNLTRELDEARRSRDGWAAEAGIYQHRCAELEAKLEDIRAIQRVAEMVHALPEGHEDWHFQGLTQAVLDR